MQFKVTIDMIRADVVSCLLQRQSVNTLTKTQRFPSTS